MGFVDLHVHSNASDGTFSPSEVVRLAARTGLDAIALTDHDTTAGIAEASRAEMCIRDRDTVLRNPCRNLNCNTALLICRRTGWCGTI